MSRLWIIGGRGINVSATVRVKKLVADLDPVWSIGTGEEAFVWDLKPSDLFPCNRYIKERDLLPCNRYMTYKRSMR